MDKITQEDIDKIECLIDYGRSWYQGKKPPQELDKILNEAFDWVEELKGRADIDNTQSNNK